MIEGDSITSESGYTAFIVYDHDYNIDDDDVHNPDQSVTGCDDDQQEKLLIARRAWFNNEWFYCGIILKHPEGYQVDSLWGIEANYPGSDNSYLTEVATEMLNEVFSDEHE